MIGSCDGTMNIEDVRQILELVREHELVEFELEQDGMKLRIRKGGAYGPSGPVSLVTSADAGAMPVMISGPVVAAGSAAVAGSTSAGPATSEDDTPEFAVVKSPIVGTFYGAPAPGSPAFVEVGSTVRKGQVLCIIEAMKLMNEIESEYEGEIVKIYVENGQPVQYGERLFAVRAK